MSGGPTDRGAVSGGPTDRGAVSGGPRIAPPPGAGDDAISASALGHQPEALAAFLRLYGTLWNRGVLDHSTRELARIRNARITDCGY